MDANQNNRNNHVQSHQNEDRILQLPPLFRNLPGFEELRRAIEEELEREEMAASFEAQAQAPDGAPVESASNDYPPLPPPPPPPLQNRAAEGGNLVFPPDASNNGDHSPRAASINNGHPPPPQDHAVEGGPMVDFESDSNSDVDDVLPAESTDG